MEIIGKAEESISESVTEARGHAEAAANSAQQASASASAAQTSERNAANSATQASQSATAAKQSEDNAAESARNAAESERNAASSAGKASGSAETANAAARSASEASASAQAAEASKTNAASSASAAEASKTNAAASASAAQASETNAAASATAAQRAVDGFDLEAGTTTTGEPGTDAAVEIQKQGTKYTANFTIPRGDKGDQASVAHDDTLTGDGTSSGQLGINTGYSPNRPKQLNSFEVPDVPYIAANFSSDELPSRSWGPILTLNGFRGENILLFFPRNSVDGPSFWMGAMVNGAIIKSEWRKIATKSDIPDVSGLTSRIATLETKLNELAVTQTRLQALEARIKSLETN